MPTMATVTMSSTNEKPRALVWAPRHRRSTASAAILNTDRRYLRGAFPACEHQLHPITNMELSKLVQCASLELDFIADTIHHDRAGLNSRHAAGNHGGGTGAQRRGGVQRQSQCAERDDESIVCLF